MGGLLGLIDLASSGIQAQSAGVASVGRNTANVNTPGYTRQTVDLVSEPGGGGVRARGVTRASDDLLAMRERSADGENGKAEELVRALDPLELSLSEAANLVAAFSKLFGGLNALEAEPTDPSRRSAAVDSARAVAAVFNQSAEAIASAQAGADDRIVDASASASMLATQVAAANRALALANDPTVRDQRDLAARQLAEILGGEARVDADGHMRFVLSNGVVIVDGDRAATIKAVGGSGAATVHVVDGPHDVDVTDTLRSGRLGGQLEFRDRILKESSEKLDALASDFATRMNAVHSAHAGLDGVSGRNLFTPPGSVTGAAAALELDQTIALDPSKLATAAVGTGPSDTTGLKAFATLRDQRVAGGGTRTFLDESIKLIGDVGFAAKRAKSDLEVTSAKTDALRSLRDSISGVSTDEELARLSQFRHATEASAKFVQTIDELLGSVINQL